MIFHTGGKCYDQQTTPQLQRVQLFQSRSAPMAEVNPVPAGAPTPGRSKLSQRRDQENERTEEMKKGDIVNIYQDPITQTDLEGEARLIEEFSPDVGSGLSIWTVEFLDDPGYGYSLRAIYQNGVTDD